MSINTMLFGKLCYRPQITKGSHITKVRHILIGSHIANKEHSAKKEPETSEIYFEMVLV